MFDYVNNVLQLLLWFYYTDSDMENNNLLHGNTIFLLSVCFHCRKMFNCYGLVRF